MDAIIKSAIRKTKFTKRLTRKQRKIRSIIILLAILTIPLVGKLSLPVKESLSIPDGYEEVIVTVMPGDRAWNIQKTLTPDEDVREMLYYVNVLNGKLVGDINPGEEVIFLQLANNQ